LLRAALTAAMRAALFDAVLRDVALCCGGCTVRRLKLIGAKFDWERSDD
jgi:hypothetical protein